MDMAQDGNVEDFRPLLQTYLTHPAYYYAGPNNAPFLSTFNAGSADPAGWASFKQSISGGVYFLPDFDNTQGYCTDSTNRMSQWAGAADGVFSWETA